MTNQKLVNWAKEQLARSKWWAKRENFYSVGMWIFMGVGIAGGLLLDNPIIAGIGFLGVASAGVLMMICGIISIAILYRASKKLDKRIKKHIGDK